MRRRQTRCELVPGVQPCALPISFRRHARRLLGEDVPLEGVPLYTDARLYAEAGVPTIGYGAGPRSFLDANGHRADERLVLTDLRAATEVVALAVAEVLLADAGVRA